MLPGAPIENELSGRAGSPLFLSASLEKCPGRGRKRYQYEYKLKVGAPAVGWMVEMAYHLATLGFNPYIRSWMRMPKAKHSMLKPVTTRKRRRHSFCK